MKIFWRDKLSFYDQNFLMYSVQCCTLCMYVHCFTKHQPSLSLSPSIAAYVMFEYGLRLGRESPGPKSLQKQVSEFKV